jgi:tagatose-6-phosphate ketose/aldose isomerase
VDALTDLLRLPENDKVSRGLLHTPAEIAQQPDSWLTTFRVVRSRQTEIAAFLSQAGLRGEPKTRPTVFLIGAGTSDYIGQSLAPLLRRCWACDVIAVPSTDLLTHMDSLVVADKKYLWISFSRSGESPEGVAVLEQARNLRPDIQHVIVSCNVDGRMIRENHNDPKVLGICLDDAVNDRGLAMTSSFSNMVIAGQCLAHENDLSEYHSILLHMVQAARDFLPRAADCAAALSEQGYTKAFFVGSGALRAVAKECALKSLELTAGKVLTMSESVLGLRHGPMAALDQHSLFVCFQSGDRRIRKYERDLLDEITRKHLVKSSVTVGTLERFNAESPAEHYLRLTAPIEITEDYRPPIDVIFGQLLGLSFSLKWGLRPDCPSPNGAISRVVHDFKIHS